MRRFGLEIESSIIPKDSRFEAKYLKPIPSAWGPRDFVIHQDTLIVKDKLVKFAWESDVFGSEEVVVEPVAGIATLYALLNPAYDLATSLPFTLGYVDQNTASSIPHSFDISVDTNFNEIGVSPKLLPKPDDDLRIPYESWFFSQIAISNNLLLDHISRKNTYHSLRRWKDTGQLVIHSSYELAKPMPHKRDVIQYIKDVSVRTVEILEHPIS